MQAVEIILHETQRPVYPRVNTIDADHLVIQGARASVAMLLTLHSYRLVSQTWATLAASREPAGKL